MKLIYDTNGKVDRAATFKAEVEAKAAKAAEKTAEKEALILARAEAKVTRLHEKASKVDVDKLEKQLAKKEARVPTPELREAVLTALTGKTTRGDLAMKLAAVVPNASFQTVQEAIRIEVELGHIKSAKGRNGGIERA